MTTSILVEKFRDIFNSNLQKSILENHVQEDIVPKSKVNKTSITNTLKKEDAPKSFKGQLNDLEGEFERDIKDRLNNFEHEILNLVRQYTVQAKRGISPAIPTRFKSLSKSIVKDNVSTILESKKIK